MLSSKTKEEVSKVFVLAWYFFFIREATTIIITINCKSFLTQFIAAVINFLS